VREAFETNDRQSSVLQRLIKASGLGRQLIDDDRAYDKVKGMNVSEKLWKEITIITGDKMGVFT
jgi:hypothetical protein